MKIWVITTVLIACMCNAPTVMAQKEYKIEEITVVNVGDGRLLFHDAKKEKSLNGEHRIIDGYHSAYLLAGFKDGFYDGTYQEYEYNKLRTEGTYKEGRKNGTFKEYSSYDGKLQTETNYADGKLDGMKKTYYSDGTVETEKEYKAGKEDGIDRRYDHDGKLVKDCNYKDGLPDGKQMRHITGTYDYIENSCYINGLAEGEYIQTYMDGAPRLKGYYKAGKKVARWIKFDELGDTLKIESYDNDELNGLSVTFGTKGQRLKEYNYRNDKKHGICKDLDYETGAVKREGEYENGKLNGKEKVLVVSNQFDFIETTTYLKGHRHGPYEAIYVKNGQLREKGEYKNDYKIGRWSRYDINGKLEKEWDE